MLNKKPNTTLEPCATCGHDRKLHACHEGECRPGFPCPSNCVEFAPAVEPEQPTCDCTGCRDGSLCDTPTSIGDDERCGCCRECELSERARIRGCAIEWWHSLDELTLAGLLAAIDGDDDPGACRADDGTVIA